jgi:hypothetical protein
MRWLTAVPGFSIGPTWRATLGPQEAMGCCEAGGGLGGRPRSRPAPLLCFVRCRRVSRFADHREAARSLAAGDDGKVCAFGRGPYAPCSEYNWRNNFSRYGRSCRTQCRPDRETPPSVTQGRPQSGNEFHSDPPWAFARYGQLSKEIGGAAGVVCGTQRPGVRQLAAKSIVSLAATRRSPRIGRRNTFP